MTKKYRQWSELEKYQLWLAYNLKAPLKIMALYLNRKTGSVNHALERFCIRPLGARPCGPHPQDLKGKAAGIPLYPKTCKQLQKIFKESGLCAQKNAVPLYWSPINKLNSDSLIVLHPTTISYLKRLKIASTPPWQDTTNTPEALSVKDIAQKAYQIIMARQETKIAQATFPETSKYQQKKRLKLARSVFLWVTFYDVVEYLKTQDVSVSGTPSRILQINQHWRYLVDGKPMTRSQVLMCANKIRYQKEQEPFLVQSISCV